MLEPTNIEYVSWPKTPGNKGEFHVDINWTIGFLLYFGKYGLRVGYNIYFYEIRFELILNKAMDCKLYIQTWYVWV